MKNEDKSKVQLENELNELHRRISELETCKIKHTETQESLRESQRMLSTLIGNLPGMAYRCLNDENWTMEFISEGSHDLLLDSATPKTSGLCGRSARTHHFRTHVCNKMR